MPTYFSLVSWTDQGIRNVKPFCGFFRNNLLKLQIYNLLEDTTN
jgi:hypothetical protein